MADVDAVLGYPALSRRASSMALGCLNSRADGGVTFSLEAPPREEETSYRSLDACFRCQRPLRASSDLFMYRGDAPFCSEECRQEQIEVDEARERETRYRRRRRRHQQHTGASTQQSAPATAQQSLYARASDAVLAT